MSARFGPVTVTVPAFGNAGGSNNGDGNRGQALDANLECRDDFAMQAQFNIVFSQPLEWLLDVNFLLIEYNLKLSLQLIGDHAVGDSAEHATIITGLDRNNGNELGDALGQFGHGVEFVSFTLGPTLLEHFQAALVGTADSNCQALGKKIITRVTSRDFNMIGFTA